MSLLRLDDQTLALSILPRTVGQSLRNSAAGSRGEVIVDRGVVVRLAAATGLRGDRLAESVRHIEYVSISAYAIPSRNISLDYTEQIVYKMQDWPL